MADEGGIQGTNKDWTLEDLRQMYGALTNVDRALNGHLSDMIGGTTFWLSENATGGLYHGDTYTNGIEFETLGTNLSAYANIYHEIGHLLDNVPATQDVFSNLIPAGAVWINTETRRVDYSALINSRIPSPGYKNGADAVQDRSLPENYHKSWEQWADTFSNYVAGNIPVGSPMYVFVTRFC